MKLIKLIFLLLIIVSFGFGQYGASVIADTDGDNTVQTVRADRGTLLYVKAHNITTTDCWIQFYDESGAITVGTTETVMPCLVPAGNLDVYGSTVVSLPEGGVLFENSIKYACTTTATGNGDPATGLILFMVYR